jgi:hypothetical protein
MNFWSRLKSMGNGFLSKWFYSKINVFYEAVFNSILEDGAYVKCYAIECSKASSPSRIGNDANSVA